MVISVFRYYADVQYRMTIRFKEYFIFYAAIAAGNLLGIALYPVSKSWSLTVFLGEFLAVLFTFCSGTIFRKPFFEKSQDFKQNMQPAGLCGLYHLFPKDTAGADCTF